MSRVIDRKFSIPEELLLRVEYRLLNPLRNKPAYGARSALICSLLAKWLQEQEEQEKPIPAKADTYNVGGF